VARVSARRYAGDKWASPEGSMGAYLARRLGQSLIVIVAVVFIVFMLMFLSGNPALLLLPPDASREDILQFSHQMGFDRPLWEQFLRFGGNLLLGDFGRSWRFQSPVLPLVLERLPATIELAVASLTLSLAIAVPLGVISAVKRNTLIDGISMVLALIGQSTPAFWLGIMLILFFAVDLGLLPTSGREEWGSIILPALTLGLTLAGRNARLVRSSVLEVLGEDYIRTARAKGLPEWRVVTMHGLRNALLPVVTVIGLELGHLLGGAVVVETVFAWPGIGLLAVQAVLGRDYPIVQAVIIISALIFVITNLLIDLLYTYLDPRISLQQP
jgi:ABC-type dipeptide/oligopeptide/nickel transport system permease component